MILTTAMVIKVKTIFEIDDIDGEDFNNDGIDDIGNIDDIHDNDVGAFSFDILS